MKHYCILFALAQNKNKKQKISYHKNKKKKKTTKIKEKVIKVSIKLLISEFLRVSNYPKLLIFTKAFIFVDNKIHKNCYLVSKS